MKKYIHILLISLLSALIIFVLNIIWWFLWWLPFLLFPEYSAAAELIIKAMILLIEIILLVFIFITHRKIWYFYTKIKNLSLSLIEIVIIIYIAFLFSIILLPAVEVAFRGDILIWKYFSYRTAVEFLNISTISTMIAAFWGLYIPESREKRKQCTSSFLLLGNMIGLVSFFIFGDTLVSFSLLPLIAVWIGNMNYYEAQVFLTTFIVPLLTTLLSFYSWRYYDRDTSTISHRGFIFALLPYIVMVFLTLYLLPIFSIK